MSVDVKTPDYLDPETKKWLRGQGATRPWGYINIYTCSECGYQLVTRDVDEGVTPFTTPCDRCNGLAQSAGYRIPPFFPGVPIKQWYRPDSLDGLSPAEIDHVTRGGLLLRKISRSQA